MMYVWFLRVNVVVCSNEWCLKQKERYLAKSHIRSLRFTNITNNPKEEPTIQIGGSYPSNIQMFFTFPPTLQGKTGEKGETGDEGPKGKDGKKGAKGKSGPFGQCPK